MVSAKRETVRRFSVEVELASNGNLILAEAGKLRPNEVRRLTIRGVVDTRAARLVIPASVAQRLGSPTTGQASVRDADGHSAQQPMAGGVSLT